MDRSILHCDMNNFYASVECHLNPALAAHPIAVCGETEERHGIVLAKNYLAKAFGIITGDELKIPADLSDNMQNMIRETAIGAFKALGCKGLVRVDFFLDNNGNLFLNNLIKFVIVD